MAKKKASNIRQAVRGATRQIRRTIAGKDLLLSGNLQTRTKTCGQERCACRLDPEARHGPYHEWTRRRAGRLVSTSLSAEEARVVARAIETYREVEALLALWERKVEQVLLGEKEPKS
jgi:hypothetical protein